MRYPGIVRLNALLLLLGSAWLNAAAVASPPENLPSPVILVWLAQLGPQGWQWLSPDEAPTAAAQLQQQASSRGLNLLLPLLDLEDRRQIDPPQLLTVPETTLRQASQRYHPDSLLSGQIVQHAGVLQAQWRLHHQGTESRWQDQADTIETLLSHGLDWLQQQLAPPKPVAASAPEPVPVAPSQPPVPTVTQQQPANPAPPAAPDGLVHLTVEKVLSMADYQRVESYLKSLAEVSQVTLERIDPEQLHFSLRPRSDPARLVQLLQSSPLLLPSDSPPTDRLLLRLAP